MFEVKKYIDELNKKKIDKIDWGLLIVFHVFVFMTMFYGDLKIIYHHSLTFLDTIFNLDMPNFYANTLANPCGLCGDRSVESASMDFNTLFSCGRICSSMSALEQAADGIFSLADTLDVGKNLKRFWFWKRKISMMVYFLT